MQPSPQKNFFQGQTFKNYKELCSFLNLSPKSGGAKLNHFALLETYFTFSRKGQSLTITAILKDPIGLASCPERKKKASFWKDTLQKLILHELSEKSELCLTTRQTLLQFRFCHWEVPNCSPTTLVKVFKHAYQNHFGFPPSLDEEDQKVAFKYFKEHLLRYAGQRLNDSLVELALHPKISLQKDTCGKVNNIYRLSWIGEVEELEVYKLPIEEVQELKSRINERTFNNLEDRYDELFAVKDDDLEWELQEMILSESFPYASFMSDVINWAIKGEFNDL